MDYSKMSDTEINELVARITGTHFDEDGPCYFDYSGIDSPYSDGDPIRVAFDPCNNPADAWPIIVDNRISLLSVECLNGDFTWLAKNKACPSRGDKNPLRAAMIVFLMKQESANVQDNPA